MDHHLTSIAIAAALAWASGIRLYAVLFLVGLAGQFHWFEWQSPPALTILSHPLVLGANALLLFIEFFADKIPGFDSIWDAVHTFIRIPAGALLAAGVMGTADGEAWALAAALIGGTITAGTHFTKAGSRVAINTSPEPVSNWIASFSEEAMVLSGLWLAFQHPVIFLLLLALFILVMIWLIPKLYRIFKAILRRIGDWLAPNPSNSSAPTV